MTLVHVEVKSYSGSNIYPYGYFRQTSDRRVSVMVRFTNPLLISLLWLVISSVHKTSGNIPSSANPVCEYSQHLPRIPEYCVIQKL